MRLKFGYKDLQVWRKAMDYAATILQLTDRIDSSRKHYRLLEQIESSCVSVASNIAEGKGRYSKKEFIQMLYIARGSLYESMTQVEIFRKMNWIDEKAYIELENQAQEIASMLVGLIKGIRSAF